jgi:hypothetical protein
MKLDDTYIETNSLAYIQLMEKLGRDEDLAYLDSPIYDPQAPGNWRQQTGACTIKSCSLWPFRPVSTPDRRSSRIQAETGRERPKEAK